MNLKKWEFWLRLLASIITALLTSLGVNATVVACM
jgi:hypothetical protein